MNHIEYNIQDFLWDKEGNTLWGDMNIVYSIIPQITFSFPSDKQEFFIRNLKTNGFRRFRLYKDLGGILLFQSEDGIKCWMHQKQKPQSEYGAISELIRGIKLSK